MKVKRCKSKEHNWRFKDSLRVTAYKIIDQDGNVYIAYAHSFGDLEMLISKIPIKTYSRDCETHFEERKEWSCLCKGDNPIHKPFWYYGRIYKIVNS